jgi:hypothetical protein
MDGNHIFAADRDTYKNIVMIRSDGGEVVPVMQLPVSEGTAGEDMAISPDGQRVVYSVRRVQSDAWIVENFDRDAK